MTHLSFWYLFACSFKSFTSFSHNEANFCTFICFTQACFNVPSWYLFIKLLRDVRCDFVLVNLGSDSSDSRKWPHYGFGLFFLLLKTSHTQGTNPCLFFYFSTDGCVSDQTLGGHHREILSWMTFWLSDFDFMTKGYKLLLTGYRIVYRARVLYY